MKSNEAEIISKFSDLIKIKKEMIQLMVPEQTYKHLEVIGNEIKAMAVEVICDLKQGEKEAHKNIKKVNID